MDQQENAFDNAVGYNESSLHGGALPQISGICAGQDPEIQTVPLT
jgi:hypothetical protein